MGLFKIDVQGAIMDAVGNALKGVAKTLDFDGDGHKDIEEQLIPMGRTFANGAQELVDSVDVPALAANAVIVAGDVQQAISDGKAMLKAIDFDKAQAGAKKVGDSIGGFVAYGTRVIAAQSGK